MILFTGGGGLLGINAVWSLAQKGEEVLIVQRHETEVPPFLESYWDKQVKETVGDIQDWSFICGLITKYNIDSIVHSAAIWPGRTGITSRRPESLWQAVSVNVTATANLLEIAHIFGLRRFTFISSSSIYGGLDAEVCHEELALPVKPPSVVQATKKASEQICGLYVSTYGMSVPMIRVARIYGPPSEPTRNPMSYMIVCAVEGKPVELPDTYEGSYTDPIHTKDLGSAISLVHLAKELKYDIYNCADGDLITYGEVADIIKEIIPNADIRLGTQKPQRMTTHGLVSISRLKEEGWIQEYADPREGIQQYVDYLKEGKY